MRSCVWWLNYQVAGMGQDWRAGAEILGWFSGFFFGGGRGGALAGNRITKSNPDLNQCSSLEWWCCNHSINLWTSALTFQAMILAQLFLLLISFGITDLVITHMGWILSCCYTVAHVLASGQNVDFLCFYVWPSTVFLIHLKWVFISLFLIIPGCSLWLPLLWQALALVLLNHLASQFCSTNFHSITGNASIHICTHSVWITAGNQ